VAESVLVIGAGMAGLCAALALAREDRTVTILDRDGPPPAGGPDEAFADWTRRGVGHLRHSHAFLARLRAIIKDHHPALLEALRAAGCRELGFKDGLPAWLAKDYAPLPGDADMAVLTSRRTTLELVMRRYVEALPGVSIIPDIMVRDLIIERAPQGAVIVRGVRGVHGEERRDWRAAVTIDASGRLTQTADALAAAGVGVADDSEDCGILYFTRHYRLQPGASEPPRGAAPGTGDLGFIKYGLFPGDSSCFSITLAVPEIETEFRQAVVRPEVFEKICALLPGLKAWTDPMTAAPISRVYGMGDLKSRWRRFSPESPPVLGFFFLGDSLIRTNPLYGRGCSLAAVEAYILRDVLAASADPAERASAFAARIERKLTPYFADMRRQDRAAIRRAARARDPAYRPSLRGRLIQGFLDDGVRIALRGDVALLRAAMRDFHMIDPPGVWLRRPGTFLKILLWWAKGRRRNAYLYPPPLGPCREEMMRQAGVAAG
jgi:2-polyprenyl-6-methoxyphenol hydroxylase-like FAD-dependent oxidoreductase